MEQMRGRESTSSSIFSNFSGGFKEEALSLTLSFSFFFGAEHTREGGKDGEKEGENRNLAK